MSEPLGRATQLEKYCALRALVEELLIALKAKQVAGVVSLNKIDGSDVFVLASYFGTSCP